MRPGAAAGRGRTRTALAALACLASLPPSQPQGLDIAPHIGHATRFVVDKPLIECNSLLWGTPLCLSGSALINVTWPKFAGTDGTPAPANVIIQNPNATGNSGDANNLWCANISVVASGGLTLSGCKKKIDQVRACAPLLSLSPPPPQPLHSAQPRAPPHAHCPHPLLLLPQNGCSQCDGMSQVLKAGEACSFIPIQSSTHKSTLENPQCDLISRVISDRLLVSVEMQAEKDGVYFTMSWNNASKGKEAWAVVSVEPVTCPAVESTLKTSGVFITISINGACVLVAYLCVTLSWIRSTGLFCFRKRKEGLATQQGGGRSHSSSNAVSQSVQARVQ